MTREGPGFLSLRSTNHAQTPASLFLDGSGTHRLVVPGGSFLLNAEFHRAGPDLVLTGADGHEIVVTGYFANPHPPLLVTTFGAVIAPDLAARLAGPLAPGEVAQARGGTPALKDIGVVSRLTGAVTVRHADGTTEVLAQGGAVYEGDVLQTGAGASVGIVFADRTTFSLGANGRMVMDELVYDPARHSGSEAFTVVQGAFSFVSGEIAKSGPDQMLVKTPVITLGVRGTTVAGIAAAEGSENSIALLPDPGGGVGQIVVSTQTGSQVLTTPNSEVQVASAFEAPPTPATLTDLQVQADFGPVILARPPQPAAPPTLQATPHGPAPAALPATPGATGATQGAAEPVPPAVTAGPSLSSTTPESSEAPVVTAPPLQTVAPFFTEALGAENQAAANNIVWVTTAPHLTQAPELGTSTTAPPVVTTSPPVTTAPPGLTHGTVVDGPVAGATVFRDLNGNGILDPGEPNSTTAPDGSFSLAGSGSTIIVVGGSGIDTATGQKNFQMSAPSGSTVVSPLTTLIQAAIAQSGGTLDATQAAARVAAAFGISATVDLLSLDTATNPDPAAVQAEAQIAAAIAQIASAAQSAGSSASSDALQSAVVAALGNELAAGTTPDLASSSGISTLLANVPATQALGVTIDASTLSGSILNAASALVTQNLELAQEVSSGLVEAPEQFPAAGFSGTGILSFAVVTETVTVDLANAQVREGGGGAVPMTGFATIIGTPGDDLFIVGGAATATLEGGGGTDILALAAAATVSPTASGAGTAGGDAYAGFASLEGTGGAVLSFAQLTGPLTIDLANDTATLADGSTIAFTGFASLIGSPEGDLIFAGGGDASLAGGGGSDTLNLAEAGTGLLDLGTGQASFGPVTQAFVGIASFVGATGDVLSFAGESGGSTIDLAAGTALLAGGGVAAFSGFTSILGAGGDLFLAGGTANLELNGGGGSATLSFAEGPATVDLATGVAILANGATESFGGFPNLLGSNADLLTVAGETAGTTIDLGHGLVEPGAGTEAIGGFATFQGGAGDDVIYATNDSPAASGAAATLSLDGGGGVNTLVLDPAAVVGTIVTQLDFAAGGASGFVVKLAEGAATPVTVAIDLFADFRAFVGDGSETASFAADPDALTIDFANGSVVDGTVTDQFAGIANILGGTGANDVILGTGNVSSGQLSLAGGGGIDTLDLSAVTTGLTVDRVGDGGVVAAATTGGTVPLAWSAGFDTLLLGSGNDVYDDFDDNQGDATNLVIDGGGGANTLAVSGALPPATVVLGTSTVLGGGYQAATLLLAATDQVLHFSPSVIDAAHDTLTTAQWITDTFRDFGTFTDAGSDVLSFAQAGAATTFDLASGIAAFGATTVTALDFPTVVGGPDGNLFVGFYPGGDATILGTGGDTYSLADGATAAQTLNLVAGRAVAGSGSTVSLSGVASFVGAGGAVLDLTGATAASTIDLVAGTVAVAGAVDHFAGFASIVAGTASDLLIVGGAGGVTLRTPANGGTVSFAEAGATISADLADGTASYLHGGTSVIDTVVGIGTLAGGQGDTLVLNGNETIDLLDGRLAATQAGSGASVTVALTGFGTIVGGVAGLLLGAPVNGPAQVASGGGAELSFTGDRFADVDLGAGTVSLDMNGTLVVESFSGYATVAGSPGNDQFLVGGVADATVIGGGGDDTVSLAELHGVSAFVDLYAGTVAFNGLADRWSGVPMIVGAAGAEQFFVDGGPPETLIGASGNLIGLPAVAADYLIQSPTSGLAVYDGTTDEAIDFTRVAALNPFGMAAAGVVSRGFGSAFPDDTLDATGYGGSLGMDFTNSVPSNPLGLGTYEVVVDFGGGRSLTVDTPDTVIGSAGPDSFTLGPDWALFVDQEWDANAQAFSLVGGPGGANALIDTNAGSTYYPGAGLATFVGPGSGSPVSGGLLDFTDMQSLVGLAGDTITFGGTTLQVFFNATQVVAPATNPVTIDLARGTIAFAGQAEAVSGFGAFVGGLGNDLFVLGGPSGGVSLNGGGGLDTLSLAEVGNATLDYGGGLVTYLAGGSTYTDTITPFHAVIGDPTATLTLTGSETIDPAHGLLGITPPGLSLPLIYDVSGFAAYAGGVTGTLALAAQTGVELVGSVASPVLSFAADSSVVIDAAGGAATVYLGGTATLDPFSGFATIVGTSGNDVFLAGPATPTYIGDGGTDTLSFGEQAGLAATIDLAAATASFADATYAWPSHDFAVIAGGQGPETFVDDGGPAETLIGAPGNILQAPTGTADYIALTPTSGLMEVGAVTDTVSGFATIEAAPFASGPNAVIPSYTLDLTHLTAGFTATMEDDPASFVAEVAVTVPGEPGLDAFLPVLLTGGPGGNTYVMGPQFNTYAGDESLTLNGGTGGVNHLVDQDSGDNYADIHTFFLGGTVDYASGQTVANSGFVGGFGQGGGYLAFSNIQSLQALPSQDVLTFGGGTVYSGYGAPEVVSAEGNPVTIDLAAGTASFDGAVVAISGFATVTGGSGDDLLVANPTLNASLDGGGGADTLSLAAFGATATLDPIQGSLVGAGATDLFPQFGVVEGRAVANFSVVLGDGADTLVLDPYSTLDPVSGLVVDRFAGVGLPATVLAENFGAIDAAVTATLPYQLPFGATPDTFVGTATSELDFARVAAVTLDLGAGTASYMVDGTPVTDQFSGYPVIAGSGGDDLFYGGGAGGESLVGNGGNDTLDLANDGAATIEVLTADSGKFNAGTGTDTYSGFASLVGSGSNVLNFGQLDELTVDLGAISTVALGNPTTTLETTFDASGFANIMGADNAAALPVDTFIGGVPGQDITLIANPSGRGGFYDYELGGTLDTGQSVNYLDHVAVLSPTTTVELDGFNSYIGAPGAVLDFTGETAAVTANFAGNGLYVFDDVQVGTIAQTLGFADFDTIQGGGSADMFVPYGTDNLTFLSPHAGATVAFGQAAPVVTADLVDGIVTYLDGSVTVTDTLSGIGELSGTAPIFSPGFGTTLDLPANVGVDVSAGLVEAQVAPGVTDIYGIDGFAAIEGGVTEAISAPSVSTPTPQTVQVSGAAGQSLDGLGVDTLAFAAEGAVTIDLAAGTATYVDGSATVTDSFTGFPTILGSAGNDVIRVGGFVSQSVIGGAGGGSTLEIGAGATYTPASATAGSVVLAGVTDPIAGFATFLGSDGAALDLSGLVDTTFDLGSTAQTIDWYVAIGNNQYQGTTGTADFAGFSSFTGGEPSDTIIGGPPSGDATVDGGGAYSLDDGRTGEQTFNLAAGQAIVAPGTTISVSNIPTLIGGPSTVLDLAGETAPFTVDLGAGSAEVEGQFGELTYQISGFATVAAGGAQDLFLAGGAADMTFAGAGGGVTLSVANVGPVVSADLAHGIVTYLESGNSVTDTLLQIGGLAGTADETLALAAGETIDTADGLLAATPAGATAAVEIAVAGFGDITGGATAALPATEVTQPPVAGNSINSVLSFPDASQASVDLVAGEAGYLVGARTSLEPISGFATIDGTSGNDSILLGGANELVNGGGGADILSFQGLSGLSGDITLGGGIHGFSVSGYYGGPAGGSALIGGISDDFSGISVIETGIGAQTVEVIADTGQTLIGASGNLLVVPTSAVYDAFSATSAILSYTAEVQDYSAANFIDSSPATETLLGFTTVEGGSAGIGGAGVFYYAFGAETFATLDLSNYAGGASIAINGFNATVAFSGGGEDVFSYPQTIYAPPGANTFDLSSSFSNLVGGAGGQNTLIDSIGGDTFFLADGEIDGYAKFSGIQSFVGLASDELSFGPPQNTGTALLGPATVDLAHGTAVFDDATVAVSGFGSVFGGAGNDLVVVNGTAAASVSGNTGFDTLSLAYVGAAVTVDLPAGTVSFADGTRTVVDDVSNFVTLIGSGADTLVLTSDETVDPVNGLLVFAPPGGGAATTGVLADFAQITGGVTEVLLQLANANGATAQTFAGGPTSVLSFAADPAVTLDLAAGTANYASGATTVIDHVSGFPSVRGAPGNDLFYAGGPTSATILGGGGSDTVSLAHVGGAATFDFAGLAGFAAYSGARDSFAGIASVAGGDGDVLALADALADTYATATVDIGNGNAYAFGYAPAFGYGGATIAISGFTSYLGSAGNDLFLAGGTANFAVTGDGGNDVLSFNEVAAATFDLAAQTAVFGNVDVGFAGIGSLVGSPGEDLFKAGGAVAETLAGGGGADTLSFAGVTGAVTVGMIGPAATAAYLDAGATVVDTFSGVAAVAGNGSADLIVFTAAQSATVDLGTGVATAYGHDAGFPGTDLAGFGLGTVTFAGFASVDGGPGADLFYGAAGGMSVAGGGGADTLDFTAAGVTVDLAAETAGLAGGTQAYSAISEIGGSGGGDLFLVAGNLAETLSGGGGNDTLSLADATGQVVVDVGAAGGTAVYTAAASVSDDFSGMAALVGDGGSATLSMIGAATVDLAAEALSGLGAAVSFADFGTVAGNTGDLFYAGPGGAAATGAGTLSFDHQSGVTVDLGAGTAQLASGVQDFSDISTIIGSPGADLFVAGGGGAVSIVGDGGADTLALAAGTLDLATGIASGGGATSFSRIASFSGAFGVELTFAGSFDPATIDLANATADLDGASYGIAGFQTFAGSAGDNLFIAGGGTNASFIGGGALDTVSLVDIGAAASVQFNGGLITYPSGGLTVTDSLSSVATLDIVGAAGQTLGLTGSETIDPVGGLLIYTPIGGTANVTAQVSGFGGYSGGTTDILLREVVASGTTGALAGTGATSALSFSSNLVNAATIDLGDAVATYSYSGALATNTFSAFPTIAGSTGADLFLAGGAGAETLSGGGGADTLSLATVRLATVDFAGPAGYATYLVANAAATETFSGIASLAGAGGDVLDFAQPQTADFATATVDLAAGTVYVYGSAPGFGFGGSTVTFAGFATVIGEPGQDLFLTGVGATATLLGGGGADTLSLANVAAATIDIAGHTASFAGGGQVFSGISVFVGSPSADLFVAGGALPETLQGGGGSDTVSFAGQSSVTVDLLGETGTALYPVGVTTAIDSFSDIASIVGGGGANVLTMANGSPATVDLGAQAVYGFPYYAGTYLLSGFTAFTGSAFADLFLAGGTAAETIAGGGGADTLSFAEVTSPVTVDLSDSGGTARFTVSGTAVTEGFSGIATVAGGPGGTSFVLADPAALGAATLVGAGADNLTIDDANAGPSPPFQQLEGIYAVGFDIDNSTGTQRNQFSLELSAAQAQAFADSDVQVLDASGFSALQSATIDLAVLGFGPGADGALTLLGGAGDDTLYGAAGDVVQTLDPGSGVNVIQGNAYPLSGGHDVYVIEPGATDTITDVNGYLLMTGVSVAAGHAFTWNAAENLPAGIQVTTNADGYVLTDAAYGFATTIDQGGPPASGVIPLGAFAAQVTAANGATVQLGGGDNVIDWLDPDPASATSFGFTSPAAGAGPNTLVLDGTMTAGLTIDLSNSGNQLVSGNASVAGFHAVDASGLTLSGAATGVDLYALSSDTANLTLWGSPGADTLAGGGGTNLLYAGGDLAGQGAADTLIGGTGTAALNIFVLDGNPLATGLQPVKIENFDAAADTIDLPGALYPGLTGSPAASNVLQLANDAAAQSYHGTSPALLIVGGTGGGTDLFYYSSVNHAPYEIAQVSNLAPQNLTLSHLSFNDLQSRVALGHPA